MKNPVDKFIYFDIPVFVCTSVKNEKFNFAQLNMMNMGFTEYFYRIEICSNVIWCSAEYIDRVINTFTACNSIVIIKNLSFHE